MASRVSGRCVFCGLGGSQPTENFSKISEAEEISYKKGNSIPNLEQYPDNDSILSKYFVQL